jgi:hypothetical protein
MTVSNSYKSFTATYVPVFFWWNFITGTVRFNSTGSSNVEALVVCTIITGMYNGFYC